ncbi:MAG: Cna B-type domain-containing protein [Clostridiales bacterium]|nr:Cna B-type domain-containing protein [Clostridiales bacterium]
MKKLKAVIAVYLAIVLVISSIQLNYTNKTVVAEGAEDSESDVQDRLLNGSFEENKDNISWGGGGYYNYQIPYTNVPYWYTTAYDKCIELFKTGSTAHFGTVSNNTVNGVLTIKSEAADGEIAAELNANEESTLFQIVKTKPGTIEEWGIMHRARFKLGGDNDKDTMAVVIGPAPSDDDAVTAETLKKSSKNSRDHFMQMIEWIRDNNMVNISARGCNDKFVVYSPKLSANGGFEGASGNNLFSLTEDDNHTEKWEIWILSSGRQKWYAYGKQAELLLKQESYDQDKYGILNYDSTTNELEYDYSYTVPQGQNKTLFAFVSFASTSGNSTYGNLLDGIYFQKKFPTLTYTSKGGTTVVDIIKDGTVLNSYLLDNNNSSHFEIVEEGNQMLITAYPDEGYGFFGAYINDQFYSKDMFEKIDGVSVSGNVLKLPYEVKGSINLKMLYAKEYTAMFDANGGKYINQPTVDVMFYEQVGGEGSEALAFTGDHIYYPDNGMYALINGEMVSQSTGTPYSVVGRTDGWKFCGWLANGHLYPHNMKLDYKWENGNATFTLIDGDFQSDELSAANGMTLLAMWKYRQGVTVKTYEVNGSESGYAESGVGGSIIMQAHVGDSPLHNIDSALENGYRHEYFAEENELICLTATPASSYDFVGWYKVTENGESLITTNREYSYYVESGVCEEIVAKFAPQLTYSEQHYIYYYNSVTGKYEESAKPYKTIEKKAGFGKTVEVFPMYMTGYSYKKDTNEFLKATLYDNNVIFKVYYNQDRRNLSYYPNKGIGNNMTNTYGYGESVIIKTPEEAGISPAQGYVFVKWNANSSGTGANYVPGSKLTLNSNTSIHAIWETEKTDVTIRKIWDDDKNSAGLRPESIVVTINATVNKVTQDRQVTLSEANNWTATLTGLDKYNYDDAGKATGEKVYTVTEQLSEDSVYTGNTVVVNGEYVITNTYHATKDLSVSKVWVHNDSPLDLRPDKIKVFLYADGLKIKEAEMTDTYTFTGLRKYNDSGTEIIYSVSEENVPYYQASVTDTENGFLITNTYNTVKKNITVNIVWDDNNNQDGIRPDKVTIVVMEDGVVIDEIETDSTSYTFEGDTNKTYSFKLKNALSGYTTSVNDNTITNSHDPAKKNISVKNEWYDDENRDGLRPAEVTVKILKNGVPFDVKKIAFDGTAVFENLPVYSEGTAINYTVQEDVTSYTQEIVTEDDIITVKNTHEPEKVKIRVKNSWSDDNNRDGLRGPVTFSICSKDGTVIESATFTNMSNPSYLDYLLPKYMNGSIIEYNVKVDNAPSGYTTNVSAYNDSSFYRAFAITNTHLNEMINFTGQVIWKDDNDYDKIRPESVTVSLYNGSTLLETRTASKGFNNWFYSFSSVVKNAAGKPVSYTVKVSEVPDYINSITVAGDVINTYFEHDSLHYDANGGSGNISYTSGRETVNVTDNIFVRNGYVFMGWNTEADGNGDSYKAGDSFSLTEGTDILYAIWKASDDTLYTVEYILTDSNGKETVDKSEKLYGTTDTLASVTPAVYEGYEYVEAKSTASGYIQGDGSLVLKLYYNTVYFDLTIKRENYGDESNGTQSFVYVVTDDSGNKYKAVIEGNGEVTIRGLKKGSYSVAQDGSWSWRYTDNSQSVDLYSSKTITFNKAAEKPFGLNGVSQLIHNVFGK